MCRGDRTTFDTLHHFGLLDHSVLIVFQSFKTLCLQMLYKQYVTALTFYFCFQRNYTVHHGFRILKGLAKNFQARRL